MRRFALRVAIVVAAAAIVGAAAALRPAWGGADVATERVSVSSAGAEGNFASSSAAVSADGRYVAFASNASNLVPNDTNGARDIFVRDRLTGTTERVNVAGTSTQGNGHSAGLGAGGPALSNDGRFVAFASSATNLASDDTNDADDVFVRDRLLGTTQRISIATDGSQGNGDSLTPSISGDSRYVTLTSLASNLVDGDDNNDRDVFLYDRLAGTTELVSVATDGTHGNFASGGLGAGPASMSSDGRYVVFGSFATNLAPDDTNGWDDIFVRDRVAGTTERVSSSTEGVEGDGHSTYPSISDDGRFVVFASQADNIVADDNNGANDVFCRDRVLGETLLLSRAFDGQQGDGASRFPVISDDGNLVAYQSDATNLVPNDTNGTTDVFVFDMQGGALVHVSQKPEGGKGNGASGFPAIDAVGDVIAFESFASNLVPNDNNGAEDVFVRGEPLGPTPTPSATPTVTATRSPTPTPTPPPPTLRGDVNCSRRVDSIDAALVLQFDAGLISSLACQDAADANGDSRINSVDAAVILQIDAGLIRFGSLPP